MGTIGQAPEVSRVPIRNLLGIGMGGHIRALYILPEVNGGLYMAPEVRELLGWGTYQGFIRGTIGEWSLYMAPEVRELLGWGDLYMDLHPH